MRNQTLEEWKTEYVTKEKIDRMVKMGATQEQAEKHYNELAEWIYIICVVQPMSGPVGETFKLKYRPSTFENPD
jgi:hypothetical protein